MYIYSLERNEDGDGDGDGDGIVAFSNEFRKIQSWWMSSFSSSYPSAFALAKSRSRVSGLTL